MRARHEAPSPSPASLAPGGGDAAAGAMAEATGGPRPEGEGRGGGGRAAAAARAVAPSLVVRCRLPGDQQRPGGQGRRLPGVPQPEALRCRRRRAGPG